MKNKLFILYVLVFFSLIGAYAQTTIVLKPGADQGKDAMIFSCAPCGYNTLNFGTTSEISAMAWTNSGSESNSRGLIEFDLNIIPANSVITNAKLSLYFNSSSSNSSHSKTSGSNASLLQRITQTWDEKTVTWENQPTTTVLNQVVLSQSTTSNQNYTDIDVTDLVIDMKNNPDQSFGFLLKLETESYYRSLIFASSDNTDPTLHPKLEITYTQATNLPTITLQPDADQGKDAMIFSCAPCGYNTLNFGTTSEISAMAWTNSGSESNSRGLIEFDLNVIPANSVITNAKLSLFFNSSSSNSSHSKTSGSNASLLQRITQTWDEKQ